MTRLSLLAYNTLTGFSDHARREGLLEFIRTVNPDIAFFSDAFAADTPPADVEFVRGAFSQIGYSLLISQEMRHDRTDWTRTAGIVRTSLGAEHEYVSGVYQDVYRVTLAGRTIIGKYFDDRNEANRLLALGDIDGADVVMGDFNAMHRRAVVARFLRCLVPLGDSFKEVDTDFTVTKNPLLRLISLFQRLCRMGQGELLERIEELGFIDTNATLTPTMHRIAQLDHIMVKRDIRYSDFIVHDTIDLSDHKPISVIIHL